MRSTPTNLVATPLDVDAAPPSTTEIPPASPPAYGTSEPPKTSTDTIPFTEGGEVARYQQEQSGMPPQQLKDLQEFVSEGAMSSPIGMELREARRTLKSGEEADGLLVMEVKKGSAAATAGLHPYTRTTHNVITGAAMAAAMVFPPAILIVPALDYTQIGESYDLIIGVDGSRVTNFLDFQDKMRDIQPGELIYFSIVRNGQRIQISVPVPPNLAQVTY
jgi:S1-C subfamily serine protease